jgi:hypothetical protein
MNPRPILSDHSENDPNGNNSHPAHDFTTKN